MSKLIALVITHLVVGIFGFALGIYVLPILTAPPSPSASIVSAAANSAMFTGKFSRDLAGSDVFHWGEGIVSVSPTMISLAGKIAPGPDYRLYLAPQFVQTEAEFNALKPRMVEVGNVKTFDNFVVRVDASADVNEFNTVVIWCESFGEFITAAQYR